MNIFDKPYLEHTRNHFITATGEQIPWDTSLILFLAITVKHVERVFITAISYDKKYVSIVFEGLYADGLKPLAEIDATDFDADTQLNLQALSDDFIGGAIIISNRDTSFKCTGTEGWEVASENICTVDLSTTNPTHVTIDNVIYDIQGKLTLSFEPAFVILNDNTSDIQLDWSVYDAALIESTFDTTAALKSINGIRPDSSGVLYMELRVDNIELSITKTAHNILTIDAADITPCTADTYIDDVLSPEYPKGADAAIQAGFTIKPLDILYTKTDVPWADFSVLNTVDGSTWKRRPYTELEDVSYAPYRSDAISIYSVNSLNNIIS